MEKKEFGLSFGQKSLWFHQQRNPDSFRYNLTFVAKVISDLDIEKLRFSIQELVIKYEALRTRYHNSGNILVQSLNKEFIPEFLICDATNWSLDDIALKIETEAQRPFDLSKGHFLRAMILLRTDSDPFFLLSTHHIAVDLWSMVHLVQDLGRAYSNKNILDCNKESINNYQNYVAYQTKTFEANALTQQEDFWNTYLAGDLPVVSLAADFPRPAKKTEHSAIKRFHIHEALSDQLRKFSLDHGITLYVTLLTAYFILLYKYTRQADLIVSSPFSGRTHSNFRKTFGFFVNPVIIRATIKDDINCIELLQEINQNITSVFANQDFPYSLLIEKKSTTYDPSRSPLCDLEFVYDRPIKIPEVAPFILGEAGEILDLGDLILESFQMDKRCIEKDLQLFITDNKEKLYCGFQYAKDLFEGSTIEHMSQQYMAILGGLIASPHEKIKNIQFFDQRNINKIIATHTYLNTPSHNTLLDLFEHHIIQNPDTVAVYDDKTKFSFGQIDFLSNDLAATLVSKGVARGDIVALCLPRSVSAIISILAIHKTGAIYLPLDDHAPQNRIEAILDDSKPKILVVADANTGLLYKERCDFINIVSLSSVQTSRAKHPFVRTPITPNDFAYLIYTSGSSGKPKGVMVQHRSMLNLLYALINTIEIYQTGQPLRVSVNAPIFFDSSIKQIIMLFAGHALDIIPAKIRMNAKDFITYINKKKVDVLDITPSQIEVLIAEGLCANSDQSNTTILIGGEKIAFPLWQHLLKATGFKSYNVYGPTECTVDATIAPIVENLNPLPVLGRSLPNIQVYVLDNNLNHVDIGMPGELYIGGQGVSNGYFNNPRLTASKFIPDPFTNTMGARLYKTGDLARYRHNGSIEFLGRVDAQIKLRGYRIELSEIESLLIKYAGVKQCVVIAHDIAGEINRIIAYIVPIQINTLSVMAIKSYLAQQLPAYMCPAQYIIINALPMTANGKLDFKNLPIEQTSSPDKKSLHSQPSSPLETWLSNLWQQLLNVEPNTHDSFFDLGGHSLLVMQLIARIQEQYKVRINISDFFDHSTIADLAKLIELQQSKNTDSIYEIAPIAHRPAKFYASYQQKRLWFLDQLTPSNPVYNISGAAEFLGPFDFEVFLKSLMHMEKNHDILRTGFYENAEDVFQSIVSERNIASRSQYIDLSKKSEKSKNAFIHNQIIEETQKPFHLKDGCLWRVLALKLNAGTHLIVLTMHHIISDGWSNRLFLQELLAHYEKFICGGNDQSTPPPFQYMDYTKWQRDWFESKEMHQQLSYWQHKLKNAPVFLNLPTDNFHSPTQKHQGASCSFTISSNAKEKLQALSQHESVTLFMTFVSILKLLLFRYSNQEDILIGTPIAGRRSKEMENILGLFANTIVLRSQNLASINFNELLQQVKKTTLEAFDNQDCPFEHIVEIVKPERNLSRSPLFQIMFVFENIEITPLKSALMDIVLQPLARTTAKFDLTFEIKNQEQLTGIVEYNTDIFHRDTIERMIGHYLQLIDEVTKNPYLALDQYVMTSTEEYQRIKQLWHNGDPFKVTKNIVIHLFEEQVRRSPEKTALVTKDGKLSYIHLNQKANQLAHYLLINGLKQKDVIGIFLPRQEEMIVAMLAVLKIGGIYLPLDPAYPTIRTHTVLNSAQATAIISMTYLKPALPTDLYIEVIYLDKSSAMITKNSPENVNLQIHTQDNLYIIYTSGSTGTPKGVVINNLNVTNFIEWAHAVFNQDFSAVLASTSICFDLSVFEIFGTLTFGGTLYLVENALALIENNNIYPITLINTVPSVIKELLHANAIPTTVTTINLAGEPLMNHLAQDIYRATSILRLYNLYGPSETTTYSTYTLIPRESTLTACHIGKPIANTFVYVLDKALNPLPIGVPGEIYIGGLGVAQGYWKNPSLTEKLFRPDPFSQSEQNDHINYMYKTGDFGKFLADSHLVYLGRIDQQVKIRGYRIEITEIEDVLNHHPNIDEVIIAACLNPNGDKCLVAYIKSIDGCTIQTDHLSDHIRIYLPEYMIPSLIVFLNEIPRSPNGKIDRSSLPPPNWQNLANEIETNDAMTELEKEILTIWQSVLGHTKIGLHDNFFTIGGHSLLATRMLIKTNEKFDIKLPIRTIFEHPTLISFTANVAQLSSTKLNKDPVIKRIHREYTLLPANNLSSQNSQQTIAASNAQQRMWLLHQFYDKTSSYNMVAAFKIVGLLDEHLLKKVLIEIIARHEILRTTFIEIDEKLYQSISGLLDLNFSKEQGALIDIIQQEANHHFNLRTGPLFKTKLIQLDEQSHILIFNMHHIIADGWSIGILIKEFSLLWQAFKAMHPSPLQELSIQYADYSVWQNTQLESTRFQHQLTYWKSQLQGYSGDRVIPANKTTTRAIAAQAGHLAIEIDSEILSRFQHLLQREGATLFMGLIAILGIVTHLYSDSEDIIIGTVVANRNHSQLEALIGFFANTLALRLDLSENLPFNQFLSQIKQTIILAYENQDFPFEKIIDEIQPIRTPNQQALFQTMLILQNTAFEEISLDGMQIEAIDVPLKEAKFDLLFNLSEKKGGLYGKLEFNADLYSSSTVENMLKHFMQLIVKTSANPEIPIKQILITEHNESEFLDDQNLDKILAELIFGNEHMDNV